MTTTLPIEVGVWREDGAVWRKVQQIGSYTSLTFTPTFQDVGSWTMTLPYDARALPLLPGRLVTLDWRGVRSTWDIVSLNPSMDETTGDPVLTVTGVGAKGRLGWCLTWPDPTAAIDVQPVYRIIDPAPYNGVTETLIRTLVAQNFRDRYGATITIPASAGLGNARRSRPNFEPLFTEVQRIATADGLGFDIELVNTSATTAALTLRLWMPADKSKRVRLKAATGTVGSWSQTDTAPTATAALVAVGAEINAATTLTANLTATATTLAVASSANFPSPTATTPEDVFRIKIDSELMRVTLVNNKTWTITRALGGTIAAAHTTGDRVTGVRQYRWPVSTTTSVAEAGRWGGVREVYTSADSIDTDEVIDAGRDALIAGQSTRSLALVAAEATGMQAFTHYDVGDSVSAEVVSGAGVVGPITSIEVAVSDTGIVVKPTVGDPNTNSTLRLAQIVRGIRRAVRTLERKQP